MTTCLIREMGHMMCDDHFYEFFESQKADRQNVNIVMSSPLARHLAVKDGNYSEALENSFVNSTNIASIQPSEICQVASVGTVKSLPPPDSSSLYSSSLVNINLATNIMEALELCVQEEYMIAMNVVGAPVKKRPAAKNNAFICIFFVCACGPTSAMAIVGLQRVSSATV